MLTIIQQECIVTVVNLIQQGGELKMTNSEMLEKVIRESGIKRSAILKATGIKAYSTLRDKIWNRTEFTASEIQKLCEILGLSNEQREAIFFAKDAESYSA